MKCTLPVKRPCLRLWLPLAVLALLAVSTSGCGAHTPRPGYADPAPRWTTRNVIFTFNSNERATKAIVNPLGVGTYTVALELTHSEPDEERFEVFLRRIVVFTIDENFEQIGEPFETQAAEGTKLIAAVPILDATRTLVVHRSVDEELTAFARRIDPGAPLILTTFLTSYHPTEALLHDNDFLEGAWEGKPRDATPRDYTIHAAGGRISEGSSFALVVERDEDSFERRRSFLEVFQVNANTMQVQGQTQLRRTRWLSRSTRVVFGDTACTQAAYSAEDGWLIAYRVGASVWGDLLDNTLTRVARSRLEQAYSGYSIGKFVIAGGSYLPIRGRYMIVAEQFPAGGRPVLISTTFNYDGVDLDETETSDLGDTQGVGLALAHNNWSQSHYYLIDLSPTTATTFTPLAHRLRPLGYAGYAYSNKEIAAIGRGVGNPSVTYGYGTDEAFYVYTERSTHSVLAGRHKAGYQYPYLTLGSDDDGQIGPLVDSGGTFMGLQRDTQLAGNEFFEVTIDGPVRKDVTLNLSTTYTMVDGEYRPNMRSRASTTRFARTNNYGHGYTRVELSPLGLRRMFATGWPPYTEAGVVSRPTDIYAQWSWEEVVPGEGGMPPTTQIKRSNMLGFRPALP